MLDLIITLLKAGSRSQPFVFYAQFTVDRLITNQLLYQLSYRSTSSMLNLIMTVSTARAR